MVKEIAFKFGRAPGVAAEVVKTTPITVFVGPNNSGKSKVLEELNRYCREGSRNVTDVIIESVKFEDVSLSVAQTKITNITIPPHRGESVAQGHIIVGKRGSRNQVPLNGLTAALQNTDANPTQFCQWYLRYNTLILDGSSRISLVSQQEAGDLQQPAHSSLQVLFQDNIKRSEVRRILHDAFGQYFTIDPTLLGKLRIRLAPRAPETEAEERGIHDAAVKYHAASLPVEHASDGVKAFTGMITEIIAGDPAVLLIDEPEAFLHPALAFTLGKEIALASSGTEKRLFVSTHSPNFVMGCIQSGAPINIVRLTYRGGVATARVLPSADILRLMRNPLLRSTGVLGGLFYEFVVVTESDADRAFYQEINERLLRFKPEWGIPNCLFLNAQNKQTVRTIIRPLRELGIPAAGVVDIDVLKEGGSVWTDFLGSGFVPVLEHQSLGTLRAALKQKCESTGRDMKRDGGVDILPAGEREAANNLFDRLAQYGLFVVRRGELESWLQQLAATGHGPAWLIDVFEKMGEDTGTQNYLRPTSGDVWEFIAGIKAWLVDANRCGIPA